MARPTTMSKCLRPSIPGCCLRTSKGANLRWRDSPSRTSPSSLLSRIVNKFSGKPYATVERSQAAERGTLDVDVGLLTGVLQDSGHSFERPERAANRQLGRHRADRLPAGLPTVRFNCQG